MQGTLLEFFPVCHRQDLVPPTVLAAVKSWPDNKEAEKFLVAEIDPEFAEGTAVCDKYNISPMYGANCLVVMGKRGSTVTYASCLVPVGYRYDMSGVVRKQLNARQVSVAPLNFVLEISQMEYGSITPIGLPHEWFLFIDPQVLASERIIIGGGLKKSKLSIPSTALLRIPNSMSLDGLAKRESE